MNDNTTVVDPCFLEVEEIKQAVDLLEESAYSKTELLAYDKYWDNIRCEKALFKGYLKTGLAQGEVKGFAKGVAKGKAEIVINMHRRGFTIEQICMASELMEEEVKKIIKAT